MGGTIGVQLSRVALGVVLGVVVTGAGGYSVSEPIPETTGEKMRRAFWF